MPSAQRRGVRVTPSVAPSPCHRIAGRLGVDQPAATLTAGLASLLMFAACHSSSPHGVQIDATTGPFADAHVDASHIIIDATPDAAGPDAPTAILTHLPPYDHIGATFQYRVDGYLVDGAVDHSVTLDGATAYVTLETYESSPVTINEYYTIDGGVLARPRVVGNGLLTIYTPSVQYLRVPLSLGDAWTQTIAVSASGTGTQTMSVVVTGEEDVTVGAGAFHCAKLHRTISGFDSAGYDSDEWWSQDKGMVKATMDSYELLSSTL